MLWGGLWLLGLLTAYAMGGFQQAMIVVAMSVVVLWVLRARVRAERLAAGKERVK
jgi:hypothetical protein